MKRTLVIVGLMLLAGLPGLASAQVTGVLAAFGPEVSAIRAHMEAPQDTTVAGVHFVTGTLHGRKIVLTQTGVGKVNAAMSATLTIEHFHPEQIVFSGIAGAIGAGLLPGDIVIGEKTVQHDYGKITADGFEYWNPLKSGDEPGFFPADGNLLALADKAKEQITLDKIQMEKGERMPVITHGVIVTGDQFVASSAKKTELRDRLNAAAVEMEGGAVAQVCAIQKTPCLVIRSLSDSADEQSRADMITFTGVAARNCAELVMKIVELIGTPEAAK
jgi:adenosylhomocysteine nucleosidase